MKIKTMGIDAVETYIPGAHGPESCISIHFANGDGWDGGRPQVQLSRRFYEVLRVAFDDCIAKDNRLNGVAELTPEQAMAIVTFALAQHAAGRNLVIHCGAGMSRSVAIAAALAKLFEWDWVNPREVINPTVYDLIWEAAHRYGKVFD